MKKRREYILHELDVKGSVKVKELSEALGCSEVTIRSDIQKMEDDGLLRRTHGGAERLRENLVLQVSAGNVHVMGEEKRRIARKAYELIRDRETIILDDSSVNFYLAEYIRQDSSKRVVVITNSMVVGVILCELEHVVLYLVGGQVNGKMCSAVGEITEESIRKFHADRAFVSAHGINFRAGMTSIGSPQMQVKKAMLSVADEVDVLVDSTKFNGGYIMVVCPLDRIDRIITDSGVSQEVIEMAREKQVRLDVV